MAANSWGQCYDFSDFCQFSAKKMPFFLKTNGMINCLHNSAVFGVKNANFLVESIFAQFSSVWS
jgi:hypothetical protein